MLDLGTQDLGHWTSDHVLSLQWVGPSPIFACSAKNMESLSETQMWKIELCRVLVTALILKIYLETLSWQLNLVEYLWEVEILLWKIYLKKLSIGGWAEVISWYEEIFWKHYMDNYTLQSINGQVGFRESIKTKLLCKVLGCRWVGGWSEVIYPDLENLSEKFTF